MLAAVEVYPVWGEHFSPRSPADQRAEPLPRLSIYPRDISRPSRREAELRFTDLRWFEELLHGGHFAALEQRESLIQQVRGFFRLFR